MRAFPATASRSAILPLFLGAGAAGFGLGLLALAVTLPGQRATPLPPPRAAAPGDVAAALQVETGALADWAPVFGVPAPAPAAPPPPPDPEPDFDDDDDGEEFFELTEYRLRGLVVEEGGGWALIESDEGVSIFRHGDILPGGERLTAIDADGIEVEMDDTLFFIGFDEDDDELDDAFDRPPPTARDPDEPPQGDRMRMGPAGIPPQGPAMFGRGGDR